MKLSMINGTFGMKRAIRFNNSLVASWRGDHVGCSILEKELVLNKHPKTYEATELWRGRGEVEKPHKSTLQIRTWQRAFNLKKKFMLTHLKKEDRLLHQNCGQWEPLTTVEQQRYCGLPHSKGRRWRTRSSSQLFKEDFSPLFHSSKVWN